MSDRDPVFDLYIVLRSHHHAALFERRFAAAVATLPFNLSRATGLEASEDKRRERAIDDSIRDADLLIAKLIEQLDLEAEEKIDGDKPPKLT